MSWNLTYSLAYHSGGHIAAVSERGILGVLAESWARIGTITTLRVTKLQSYLKTVREQLINKELYQVSKHHNIIYQVRICQGPKGV